MGESGRMVNGTTVRSQRDRQKRLLAQRVLVALVALFFGGGAAGNGCFNQQTPTPAPTLQELCHNAGYLYCFGNYPRTHQTCCPVNTPYLNPCEAVRFSGGTLGGYAIDAAACSVSTARAISDWGPCASVTGCY